MITRTNQHPGHGMGRFVQQWGLLLMMAVVLCGAWVYLISSFGTHKRHLVEERQRELAQLNRAVAYQTAGLLKRAETQLKTLDRFLQANPKADPRTDRQFVALSDMLRQASNGLVELRMASADGKLYDIPSLNGVALADVKERGYYTRHLASGERELYVGDPAMNRVSGKWGIPISWRLENPVSGMLVMIAAVELDDTAALQEKLGLTSAGTITLMKAKGVSVPDTPHEQTSIGNPPSRGRYLRTAFGTQSRERDATMLTPAEGLPRVTSYQRLDDYPVIVMVTEGVQDVLAPFYAQRTRTFAILGMISLVLMILTVLLQRFLRALHAAQDDLQREATIDSLTGTLTRRVFLEIAEREFGRAHRYQRPGVVLALDIDHFKRVNDTHGHGAGDRVLRECCAAWLTVLREQDFLGRTGGEEFCAILPETGLEGARLVADRLRQATSGLRFPGLGTELSVTVSIGLASIAPDDEQLVQVMERADKALYLAKNRGRNRVETAQPSGAAEGYRNRVSASPVVPASAPAFQPPSGVRTIGTTTASRRGRRSAAVRPFANAVLAR